MKARLESLGWVRNALVQRRLPDSVYIGLTEAEPVALWQLDGAFQLMDRTGKTFDKDDA